MQMNNSFSSQFSNQPHFHAHRSLGRPLGFGPQVQYRQSMVPQAESCCPTCQNSYDLELRLPKLLPGCCHTFCLFCLSQSEQSQIDEMVAYHQNGMQVPIELNFECPLCLTHLNYNQDFLFPEGLFGLNQLASLNISN